MNKLLKIFIITSIVALVGCSNHAPGVSLQGGRNCIDNRQANFLSAELHKHGAKVFDREDYLEIVLYCNEIFNLNSVNLNSKANVLLSLVDRVVSCYRDPTISVTVFFKESSDYSFSKGLSMARAENILRYLWKKGIDSNFVYSDAKSLTYSDSIDPSNVEKVVISIRK